MINSWHLLWIIPISASVGFISAAVMCVMKMEDIYDD